MTFKNLFGYVVLNFIFVSELHIQTFSRLVQNSFSTDFCLAAASELIIWKQGKRRVKRGGRSARL